MSKIWVSQNSKKKLGSNLMKVGINKERDFHHFQSSKFLTDRPQTFKTVAEIVLPLCSYSFFFFIINKQNDRKETWDLTFNIFN